MSAHLARGLDLSDLAALTGAIETAQEIAQRMSEELGREQVMSCRAEPDGRRVLAAYRDQVSCCR